jgi:hypothetical protein
MRLSQQADAFEIFDDGSSSHKYDPQDVHQHATTITTTATCQRITIFNDNIDDGSNDKLCLFPRLYFFFDTQNHRRTIQA